MSEAKGANQTADLEIDAPTPKGILERLARGEILLAEGAMGTEQQERGLEQGDCGEEWNISIPDRVREIHRSYVQVGAEIIYTNTFGATELRLDEHRAKGRLEDLREHGIDPDDLREVTRLVNLHGARLAREASEGGVHFVAGDMGPAVGDKLINGFFTEEEVSATYRDQALFLKEGGVDLLAIETVFDPQESTLAYRAVKDLGLPVLVSLAITRRSHLGRPATDFGILVEKIPELYPDADIVGINCGQDIDLTLEAVGALRGLTDKPILAKPNAGIPEYVKGKIFYSLTPDDLASYAKRFAEAGANIIGGCCGTTPDHIGAMRVVVSTINESAGLN